MFHLNVWITIHLYGPMDLVHNLENWWYWSWNFYVMAWCHSFISFIQHIFSYWQPIIITRAKKLFTQILVNTVIDFLKENVFFNNGKKEVEIIRKILAIMYFVNFVCKSNFSIFAEKQGSLFFFHWERLQKLSSFPRGIGPPTKPTPKIYFFVSDLIRPWRTFENR